MGVPNATRPPSRRRGVAILYLGVALTTVLLMASLAVDFARVQAAKTQLRTATDAAARYAATGLSDGTYYAKATAAAAQNRVDGTPVALQAADVVTGNYANGVFAAGGTPANAVLVTAQRSAARGNAIPVLFAVGIRSCNVTASSVAVVAGGTGYGVVALSGANVNNALTVDGYNAAGGTYAATKGNTGSFANGGSWNLSNTATIDGDLYYSGNKPTNGTVTGNRTLLPASPTLASQYPLVGVPAGLPNKGNYNGGSLTLAAGSYWYSSFQLNAAETLTVLGPVNLYVSGNITLNGTANAGGLPANLKVYNTVSAGVNVTSSGSICADIYAPDSPANLNGTVNLYGTLVCGQFSSSGGQSIHVDTSQLSGGQSIATVR